MRTAIDESISILTESKMHVTKLSEDFTGIKRLLESSATSSGDGQSVVELTATQLRNLFFNLHPFTHAMLYALYKGAHEILDIDKRFNKFFWKPIAAKYNLSERSERMFYGMFLESRNFLFALGLIGRDDDNNISIDSGLQELIQDEIERKGVVEEEMASNFIEAIKGVS